MLCRSGTWYICMLFPCVVLYVHVRVSVWDGMSVCVQQRIMNCVYLVTVFLWCPTMHVNTLLNHAYNLVRLKVMVDMCGGVNQNKIVVVEDKTITYITTTMYVHWVHQKQLHVYTEYNFTCTFCTSHIYMYSIYIT